MTNATEELPLERAYLLVLFTDANEAINALEDAGVPIPDVLWIQCERILRRLERLWDVGNPVNSEEEPDERAERFLDWTNGWTGLAHDLVYDDEGEDDFVSRDCKAKEAELVDEVENFLRERGSE